MVQREGGPAVTDSTSMEPAFPWGPAVPEAASAAPPGPRSPIIRELRVSEPSSVRSDRTNCVEARNMDATCTSSKEKLLPHSAAGAGMLSANPCSRIPRPSPRTSCSSLRAGELGPGLVRRRHPPRCFEAATLGRLYIGLPVLRFSHRPPKPLGERRPPRKPWHLFIAGLLTQVRPPSR